MYTDPISDLLTRIRNASRAHHETVSVPHSKVKENILKIMQQYGFIEEYEVEGDGAIKVLEIKLKENRPDITLKRISSPGQRIYIKNVDLKSIKKGLGIQILSTSKGIMSNVEAYKNKIGGELLCEIF